MADIFVEIKGEYFSSDRMDETEEEWKSGKFCSAGYSLVSSLSCISEPDTFKTIACI